MLAGCARIIIILIEHVVVYRYNTLNPLHWLLTKFQLTGFKFT